MRRCFSPAVLVAVLILGGCGKAEERPRSGGRATPVVTAPRITPSTNGSIADLPRDWYLVENDGRGLMLLNFSTDDIWIYVTVDDAAVGSDLEPALEGHRRAVKDSPIGRVRDTGVVETAHLGQAAWSWGTFSDKEESREELVLFVPHPRRGVVISLRYLFPSDGGEIAPRLKELVGVADAIVPAF
jgi:hypothetical protein